MSLDNSYERRFGPITIAGVDEVGRGPWAGPVLAAAVILNPEAIPEGLNDSKKLSAKRRETICAALQETAICVIGAASVEEIDRINILQASLLAMERALAALPVTPDLALIDGKTRPGEPALPRRKHSSGAIISPPPSPPLRLSRRSPVIV